MSPRKKVVVEPTKPERIRELQAVSWDHSYGRQIEEWEKGGKEKHAPILGPGRKETRDTAKKMRRRLRREGVEFLTGIVKNHTTFTKPTLGGRRSKRRSANKLARRARRSNR